MSPRFEKLDQAVSYSRDHDTEAHGTTQTMVTDRCTRTLAVWLSAAGTLSAVTAK